MKKLKNTVLYNEILQETLRDITIALVLMVMIIFIVAYLLSRLIYSFYCLMDPRHRIDEYEVEIAQRKLNVLEKELLRVEND